MTDSKLVFEVLEGHIGIPEISSSAFIYIVEIFSIHAYIS